MEEWFILEYKETTKRRWKRMGKYKKWANAYNASVDWYARGFDVRVKKEMVLFTELNPR